MNITKELTTMDRQRNIIFVTLMVVMLMQMGLILLTAINIVKLDPTHTTAVTSPAPTPALANDPRY